MNKDQIKGTHKDAGTQVGNKGQPGKGSHKQGTGKTEKRPGDVKQMEQDAKNPVNDATQSS